MKVGIIVGTIIFAVIFIGIYILNQQKDTPSSDPGEDVERIIIGDPESINPNNIGSESALLTSPDSGSYQVFSQGSFDRFSNQSRVLFFYASWCPECKEADRDFTANALKLPKDLVLFRINYNDSDTDLAEKDLAKKYGIVYQHTFVQIDQDGNEIVKWNGGGVDKLISQIK